MYEELFKAFSEEGTIEEIAKKYNTTVAVVSKFFRKHFTEEDRKARKIKNYHKSKLGSANPMSGKFGEQHPNFKGEVSDCKGYLLYLKPHWYTGRTNSKHVFFHNIVMCEALGITEIPKGWAVHHIDGNRLNNDISNLALLRNSAHTRLHYIQRKVNVQ